MTDPIKAQNGAVETEHLARLALVSFLITFLGARLVVFLIMSRRLPDMFLHVGGAHVHHLNYGILLLSLTGAFLLFTRPAGAALRIAAVVYALALGLTFDEYGMWLNLGGGYWQRASLDAIITVAAFLTLIACAPALEHWKSHHYIFAALVVLLIAFFFVVMGVAIAHAHSRFGPSLELLEMYGPPSCFLAEIGVLFPQGSVAAISRFSCPLCVPLGRV